MPRCWRLRGGLKKAFFKHEGDVFSVCTWSRRSRYCYQIPCHWSLGVCTDCTPPLSLLQLLLSLLMRLHISKKKVSSISSKTTQGAWRNGNAPIHSGLVPPGLVQIELLPSSNSGFSRAPAINPTSKFYQFYHSFTSCRAAMSSNLAVSAIFFC
jgi:hypothetical protein